jgi:hypothetical protein
MATFADNFAELMRAMDMSLPLAETLVSIESLRFIHGAEGRPALDVLASPGNMKGRLFIEMIARQAFLGGTFTCLGDLDRLQTVGKEFFAEYWDDEPGTGKHAIIDGLRYYQQVLIGWKPHEEPTEVMTFECLLHRLVGFEKLKPKGLAG